MTGPTALADGRAPATDRKFLLFALLYFSEGAPIGLIWWALPVWLKTAGSTAGEIATVLAVVTWPWALKFLWAPVVDSLRGGALGIRGAILVSQALMILTLLPLFVVGLDAGPDWLVPLFLLHAVVAATQDAAIDTLAVHSLPVAARGAANAWMQVGMLAGRALFGGAAVLVAARFGERFVLGALLVAIAAPGLYLLLRGEEPAGSREGGGWRRLARDLGSTFKERSTLIGFAAASTVGAGYESLASLAGPLLIDHGASEDAVGAFFLVPSVACLAVGAVLGGHASDRFGRRRAAIASEAAAAIVVAVIGVFVWFWPGNWAALFALLAALYLAGGAATASLYALLMDLTRPAVAATQFSLFMAGINLCYVWATASFGQLIDGWGYGPAMVVMSVCSLVALGLVRALPRGASDA